MADSFLITSEPPAARWSRATVHPGMWVDPADGPRENGVWPVGERDTLVAYLRSYRLTLELKCADLDAEQLARRSVPPDEAKAAWRAEVAFAERFVADADFLRERSDGRVGQLVTEAPQDPGSWRGRWGDSQQDPLVGRELGRQLVIPRDDPAVLLADSADEVQVGGDVLADLYRAGKSHVTVAGRVVDDELDPGIAAEDVVLGAIAGRRHVELLAVPVEPVGTDVRAAVLADAGDLDVKRLGEEGFEFR
jgi:hypothetical protein